MVFGIESELAVWDGRQDAETCARELLEHARRRLPHLPAGRGFHLEDGSRLYLDGSLLELASAESTNPRDCVRVVRNGLALVTALAAELRPAGQPLRVFAGNTQYSGSDSSVSSFASHENYHYQTTEPEHMRASLIPFLVSRLLFTGSGGFAVPTNGVGRFVLSPRASMAGKAVDPEVVRPLFDGREEPLGIGRRLHIVCGDATRSDLSTFLRIGTAALVVALVERGEDHGDKVQLAHTAGAISIVNSDFTFRRPLRLARGGHATALDIQEHYLRRARASLSDLPGWAPDLCDAWGDVLERLRSGGAANVSDRLDWAIRLAVFLEHARRNRIAWRTGPPMRLPRQEWAGLFALDAGFGQIAPEPTLWINLCSAGALAPEAHGVAAPADTLEPPTAGRGRLRAALVRRLSETGRLALCGWDTVIDLDALERVDLPDPHSEEETWTPVDVTPSFIAMLLSCARGEGPPRAADRIRDLLCAKEADALRCACADDAVEISSTGVDLRELGRLAEAEALARASLAIDETVRDPGDLKIAHRRNNLAVVLLMRGAVPEAAELLDLARGAMAQGPRHLLTARNSLLCAALAMLQQRSPLRALEEFRRHFDEGPLPNPADITLDWNIGALLRHLEPRVRADHFRVLEAGVNVFNRCGRLLALDEALVRVRTE